MLRPSIGKYSALALAVLAMALSPSAPAQTVTYDPPDWDFTLDPGETTTATATVCLPGQVTKADIYLLADVTTSMVPVLDQLKADAASIVSQLLATPGIDMQVGIGSYRDFPFDPQAFIHQVSPTTDNLSLEAGINAWNANGGGDGSEGQFYALYEVCTNPAIGFRPDAKRIIVWFGDSPGHDPICSEMVGGGVPAFEIDEALLTTALQTNGPGGAAIIAIGTPTSFLVYPTALDDNPTLFAQDYTFLCEPGGTSGQATRLATATGGISTTISTPEEITEAILDAVESVLTTADVGAIAAGAVGSFITDIDPPLHEDVVLPSNPKEEVCVSFDITFEGQDCEEQTFLYEGDVTIDINGTPIDTKDTSITQPSCYTPFGTLLVGVRRTEIPLVNGNDPLDLALVVPTLTVVAPFSNFPPMDIPDNPALLGFEIYLQCVLEDELNYSLDPIKASHGLIATVGNVDNGQTYGVGSGLVIQLQYPALLGKRLKVQCLVQNPGAP